MIKAIQLEHSGRSNEKLPDNFENMAPENRLLCIHDLTISPIILRALCVLGTLYVAQKSYDSAERYMKQTLEIISGFYGKNAAVGMIGDTYQSLGFLYGKREKYDLAIEWYRKALDFYNGLPVSINKAVLLNKLGEAFKAMGNLPEAKQHYCQCMEFVKNYELSCKSKDLFMAITYSLMGLAETYFYDAAGYCNRIPEGGAKHLKAGALHNLGVVRKELRKYPEAVKALTTSQSIYQKHDDKHGFANSLFILGETYIDMGRLKKAHAHLSIALRVYQNISRSSPTFEIAETRRSAREGIALAYLQLGNAERQLHQHQSSQRNLYFALSRLHKINLTKELALTHHFAGIECSNNSQFYRYQEHCYHALAICQELPINTESMGLMADTYVNIGNNALFYEQMDEAREVFLKALTIISNHNLHRDKRVSEIHRFLRYLPGPCSNIASLK